MWLIPFRILPTSVFFPFKFQFKQNFQTCTTISWNLNRKTQTHNLYCLPSQLHATHMHAIPHKRWGPQTLYYSDLHDIDSFVHLTKIDVRFFFSKNWLATNMIWINTNFNSNQFVVVVVVGINESHWHCEHKLAKNEKQIKNSTSSWNIDFLPTKKKNKQHKTEDESKRNFLFESLCIAIECLLLNRFETKSIQQQQKYNIRAELFRSYNAAL